MNLDTPELATAIARPLAPGWAALRRGAFLLDQAIGRTCEAIGATLVRGRGLYPVRGRGLALRARQSAVLD